MAHPEPPLAGATIAGKYRIVRVIGSGAMGVVCEARHVELGKRVALKLVAPQLAASEDAARRFRREARAAGALESDHVVQVFDAGDDPEHGLFMVLEYLAGEDLEARLERDERLPTEEAASIALQVARALTKAHAAGIVHRDLKPANVFLVEREDGATFVKVVDFGISKLLEPDLSKSGALVTQAGIAVGTPQYASPEQAQGLPDVGAQTDVWSLGAVLYEMLAGRPAYLETPTYEEFVERLVSQPPDPLRDVAPWVPPALAAVVHAALQHDLAARIPDAATFARLLVQAVPAVASESGERRAVERPGGGADDTLVTPPIPDDDDGRTLVMSSPPALAEPRPRSVPPRPAPRPSARPPAASAPRAPAPPPPPRRPPAVIPPAPATMPTPPPIVLPDSDEWPTNVRGARAPATAPVDSGGILVRPRAALPTMPSIERIERRRTKTRLIILAVTITAALALAGVLWLLVMR